MMSENGVHPDIIVCRTERPLVIELRQKIALFCNVKTEAVIEAADAASIYEVPLIMMREKLDVICLKKLNITQYQEPELSKWKEFLDKLKYPKAKVNIGLIGKYIELQDAYKSILEAFVHAGAINECKVEVINIHSEFITEGNVDEKLSNLDGLLVAPGFGHRGIEGKILAVKYAREHKLPFFGICLGMQMSVVEFGRNVLHLDAHSTEMKEYTTHPVISLMAEQKTVMHKGGTMRLGSYPCKLEQGSKAAQAYGNVQRIEERHRHRFEFNNEYKAQFENAGMKCTGINPDSGLVEIIELPEHPYFVAAQFHPEYKSTVMNPHPLFVSFVKAAKEYHSLHVSETSSLADAHN
jgi:CTP synthase